MADAQDAEPKDKKASNAMVGTAVRLGLIILVPAVLALLLFFFLVKPMLAPTDLSAPADQVDTIPATAVTITFDETQATVLTDNAAGPAPLLVYQVAMACSDSPTMATIEGKKAWFTSMVNRLHRNRSRAELNDPTVQEAILRQARQEANQLLKRLAPGASGEVIEVMHLKYTIVDL